MNSRTKKTRSSKKAGKSRSGSDLAIKSDKNSTLGSSKSIKRKKGNSSSSLRRKAALFLILATIAVTGFYFYVDSIVERRLASGGVQEGSKVFSDADFFRKGQKISPEYLRTALNQRKYSLVTNQAGTEQKTLGPGEFFDDGKSIKVATRQFQDALGTQIKSVTVNAWPVASDEFALEPVALANLGSADTRAFRFLAIAKTPQHLIDAVIAIEDERFYNHFGLDPTGILRAMATNIAKGKLAQGGSTITQQLAKNLFFSPRRSIKRKLLEIPAAISLERRLDKQKILELYLNEVYLGQDGAVAIHGMGEAARAFFGKDASKLDASESALLAGLIQGPSLYNPKRYPERAIKRRNTVLDKMCQLGFLDTSQCEKAKNSNIKLAPDPEYKPKVPFYLTTIQETLSEHLNLDTAISQGLKVRTGIQAQMQECAEQAIKSGTTRLEKSHPGLLRRGKPLEAALVAIEPYSGKIKAWVGGRDFHRSQFDRVSKAKRQIGSTIKPFVYLTALDASLNSYKTATATSVLSDRPMELELVGNKTWTPENYDHEFRGDVTLRYALEHSLNIPAVYISQKFGVKSLAKVIKNFNLQENPQDLPAIALGAIDTSLLKLTSAYAALANGGIYVTPRLYISAQDSDGNILSSLPLQEKKVANEGPVFVLTSILQGVVERGTATAIRSGGYKGPAAGKTGTTNDARDAWFVGYTPELSAGVWVGYDDNKKIGLTGGGAAAPIWRDFMSCVSKNQELINFVPPASVSLVEIDPASGRRISADCLTERQPVLEYYVKGTEPENLCSINKDSVTTAALPTTEVIKEKDLLAEPFSPKRERSLWDNLFD